MPVSTCCTEAVTKDRRRIRASRLRRRRRRRTKSMTGRGHSRRLWMGSRGTESCHAYPRRGRAQHPKTSWTACDHRSVWQPSRIGRLFCAFLVAAIRRDDGPGARVDRVHRGTRRPAVPVCRHGTPRATSRQAIATRPCMFLRRLSLRPDRGVPHLHRSPAAAGGSSAARLRRSDHCFSR